MSQTDTQATDTSVSEASTNEDTQETDVDLEDMVEDLNALEDDEETDETEESASDESANESAAETEEESAEDEDEEPQGNDTDPEAERKRHNDEMARRRIAEREAREAAKQKAEQEFIHQDDDPVQQALRQIRVETLKNTINTNTNALQTGLDKAVATIDILRDGPPEVKEELANALDDFERMYVVKNSFGDPIEVKGDVYEFLVNKAESIRRLTGIRVANKNKAKAQTKARTLTPPSRAPKQAAKDPDLQEFDAVFDDE